MKIVTYNNNKIFNIFSNIMKKTGSSLSWIDNLINVIRSFPEEESARIINILTDLNKVPDNLQEAVNFLKDKNILKDPNIDIGLIFNEIKKHISFITDAEKEIIELNNRNPIDNVVFDAAKKELSALKKLKTETKAQIKAILEDLDRDIPTNSDNINLMEKINNEINSSLGLRPFDLNNFKNYKNNRSTFFPSGKESTAGSTVGQNSEQEEVTRVVNRPTDNSPTAGSTVGQNSEQEEVTRVVNQPTDNSPTAGSTVGQNSEQEGATRVVNRPTDNSPTAGSTVGQNSEQEVVPRVVNRPTGNSQTDVSTTKLPNLPSFKSLGPAALKMAGPAAIAYLGYKLYPNAQNLLNYWFEKDPDENQKNIDTYNSLISDAYNKLKNVDFLPNSDGKSAQENFLNTLSSSFEAWDRMIQSQYDPTIIFQNSEKLSKLFTETENFLGKKDTFEKGLTSTSGWDEAIEAIEKLSRASLFMAEEIKRNVPEYENQQPSPALSKLPQPDPQDQGIDILGEKLYLSQYPDLDYNTRSAAPQLISKVLLSPVGMAFWDPYKKIGGGKLGNKGALSEQAIRYIKFFLNPQSVNASWSGKIINTPEKLKNFIRQTISLQNKKLKKPVMKGLKNTTKEYRKERRIKRNIAMSNVQNFIKISYWGASAIDSLGGVLDDLLQAGKIAQKVNTQQAAKELSEISKKFTDLLENVSKLEAASKTAKEYKDIKALNVQNSEIDSFISSSKENLEKLGQKLTEFTNHATSESLPAKDINKVREKTTSVAKEIRDNITKLKILKQANETFIKHSPSISGRVGRYLFERLLEKPLKWASGTLLFFTSIGAGTYWFFYWNSEDPSQKEKAQDISNKLNSALDRAYSALNKVNFNENTTGLQDKKSYLLIMDACRNKLPEEFPLENLKLLVKGTGVFLSNENSYRLDLPDQNQDQDFNSALNHIKELAQVLTDLGHLLEEATKVVPDTRNSNQFPRPSSATPTQQSRPEKDPDDKGIDILGKKIYISQYPELDYNTRSAAPFLINKVLLSPTGLAFWDPENKLGGGYFANIGSTSDQVIRYIKFFMNPRSSDSDWAFGPITNEVKLKRFIRKNLSKPARGLGSQYRQIRKLYKKQNPQLDESANNKNESRDFIMNKNKKSEGNKFSTNKINILMNNIEKTADIISKEYYQDALKDLDDEYAKSYYAGLKSMYDKKPKADKADYQKLYQVHEETGTDLIKTTHPNSVTLAESMGKGGLVENVLEQQRHNVGVALSMPTGNFRGKYAAYVTALKKLASIAISNDKLEEALIIQEAIVDINKLLK